VSAAQSPKSTRRASHAAVTSCRGRPPSTVATPCHAVSRHRPHATPMPKRTGAASIPSTGSFEISFISCDARGMDMVSVLVGRTALGAGRHQRRRAVGVGFGMAVAWRGRRHCPGELLARAASAAARSASRGARWRAVRGRLTFVSRLFAPAMVCEWAGSEAFGSGDPVERVLCRSEDDRSLLCDSGAVRRARQGGGAGVESKYGLGTRRRRRRRATEGGEAPGSSPRCAVPGVCLPCRGRVPRAESRLEIRY